MTRKPALKLRPKGPSNAPRQAKVHLSLPQDTYSKLIHMRDDLGGTTSLSFVVAQLIDHAWEVTQ
jgi:hypothetical protein